MTIDVEDRKKLLGGGHIGPPVRINAVGKMVEYWWKEINHHYFPGVSVDEFVVMPDHVHGILRINNIGGGADTHHGGQAPVRRYVGVDRRVDPKLGDIIQWFKTMTTNEYIRGLEKYHWPKFDGRLWQRNYFEKIIRDKKGLEAVRRYIRENPKCVGVGRGVDPKLSSSGKNGADTPVRPYAIAVIGSRRMSSYGKQVVELLVPELIRKGFKIVTGEVRGVNEWVKAVTKKYRGKLEVMGSIDGFEQMNEMMARESDKLLVIEGGEKSGTILVAVKFLDMGKEVWVVPGRITDETSAATNWLLKNGAMVVTEVKDVG